MTTESAQDYSKYQAANRRRRQLKKLASGVPLPMFACDGEGYSKIDLVRHIKIGNALHLRDLMLEKGK
jgi:hypothetical protein